MLDNTIVSGSSIVAGHHFAIGDELLARTRGCCGSLVSTCTVCRNDRSAAGCHSTSTLVSPPGGAVGRAMSAIVQTQLVSPLVRTSGPRPSFLKTNLCRPTPPSSIRPKLNSRSRQDRASAANRPTAAPYWPLRQRPIQSGYRRPGWGPIRWPSKSIRRSPAASNDTPPMIQIRMVMFEWMLSAI